MADQKLIAENAARIAELRNAGKGTETEAAEIGAEIVEAAEEAVEDLIED